MVRPPEVIDGVPFSVDGLKSTKQSRVQQVRDSLESGAKPPQGYTSNTNKEALSLEYISNFRQQFESVYPSRRRLFLTSPNEYGVEKFVCTTLRPTLLPYRRVGCQRLT
ncbi:unnamed protein product [Discosporangium mesarthrocarpum]